MASDPQDPTRERWAQAYREAPELFDAFARAEDPEGLVVRRLLDHAELKGRTVLEVGAGTGRISRELASHAGLYLAVEPAPGLLAHGLGADRPAGVQILRALGQRLPLGDASVDVIVAAWVLANLRDEVGDAMAVEFRRVLRPGGEAWLVENGAGGDFHALRGGAALHEDARVRRLEGLGFPGVEQLMTELRFPSEEEAARVLGYLCGDRVGGLLRAEPRARLSHAVMLLRLRS
ncbi:MAG TPA: class I SAM-dependent methyltransferase [Holophagaceae bacterium]|nr:class I SAM-dependent methyltransferase [Holophagaceae bacterium]